MIKRDFKGKYKEQFNYVCSRYEFRINIVTNRIEYRELVNGKVSNRKKWFEFDDRKRDSISVEIMENSEKDIPTGKLDQFVNSEQASEEYNPFQDYFQHLKEWDGKIDYIGQLSKTIEVEDSERFRKVLEKFLVGTISGLIDDEETNDVCLVLQGGQGTGKTRWMRKLLPKEFRFGYFNETNIDTRNKDHVLWLSQYWFIHLDELQSLSSNSIEAIKSFITRKHISLRTAYGRHSANYIRRASFLGSVNNDKFLSDTTGNRRWLVFKTGLINYEHEIDINGVWSQVHALWRNGYNHWFDAVEINELNKANEEFREIGLEEELVLTNFKVADENDPKGDYYSSTDVIVKLTEVNNVFRGQLKSRVMGRILTKIVSDENGIIKRPGNVSKYWLKFVGIIHHPLEKQVKEEQSQVIQDDLPF